MWGVGLDVSADALKNTDPPELELQVVVSCWIWVLGTKLRSSARAASALNHWVISPARWLKILNQNVLIEKRVLFWLKNLSFKNLRAGGMAYWLRVCTVLPRNQVQLNTHIWWVIISSREIWPSAFLCTHLHSDTCTHTFLWTHPHSYTCTHTHTFLCTCPHSDTHIHSCAHTHIQAHTHTHTHTNSCAHT